ncbi:MAG: LysR family transcriptional regulator [Rhodomicrobium sp.]
MSTETVTCEQIRRDEIASAIVVRIRLGRKGFLCHGKVRLMESIDEHGSISAAARAMDMTYRQAWKLIDAVNALFDGPVISAKAGGSHGGGASLTELGRDVVRRYRNVEKTAALIAAGEMAQLGVACRSRA